MSVPEQEKKTVTSPKQQKKTVTSPEQQKKTVTSPKQQKKTVTSPEQQKKTVTSPKQVKKGRWEEPMEKKDKMRGVSVDEEEAGPSSLRSPRKRKKVQNPSSGESQASLWLNRPLMFRWNSKRMVVMFKFNST